MLSEFLHDAHTSKTHAAINGEFAMPMLKSYKSGKMHNQVFFSNDLWNHSGQLLHPAIFSFPHVSL